MTSSSKLISKAEVASRAANVRQTLEWFKNSSYQREDANQTFSRAELLKNYSQLKVEYAVEDRNAMVSAYDKLPRAVVDMWSFRNAKNERKISESFSLLLDALGAVIEASESFCRLVSKQGVIQLLIADLGKQEFLAVIKNEAVDSLSKRFVEQYLTIMHNIINAHGVVDGANAIRSVNGVELLSRYVEAQDDFVKVEALFVLGAVVNDEEQEKLSAVIQDSTVSVIIRLLKESKGPQAICLATVLTDVSVLANFSERFVDLLLKQGILPILEQIIVSDQSKYANAVKHLAAKCCWSFTFYSAGRDAIKANNSLMQAMEQMSHRAGSEDLSRACSGVLWGMQTAQFSLHESASSASISNDSGLKRSGGTDKNAQQGHVMLSYSWNSQQAVLKMNDYLKANGVRTWIDVNDMHGSTVAAMAAAVEKSSAVVVCFSQAYFQSANCRAEAEYAFNLKKPIIPARMENYKAHGWLGLILGAKLYYDFAEEQRFSDAVSRLLAGILEVSNPASNVLPDGSNLRIDVSDDSSSFEKNNKPNLNAIAASSQKLELLIPNVRQTLEKWKPQEVNTWLQLNGLAKYGEKFAEYDGQAILGMIIMQYRAPDVLYDSLRADLRLDLLGLTRFVSALNKLATHPKQALGIDVA